MSITTDGDREEAAAAASNSLAGLLPASFRKAFGSSTEVAIVQEVDGQLVMRRKLGTGWKTLTPGGKSPDAISGGAKQKTSVLQIGLAPSPVPIGSRITPPIPVAFNQTVE